MGIFLIASITLGGFMRRSVIASLLVLILSTPITLMAENFTLGIGPIGNIFVVDANPELGIGVGGQVFLDYRWSPRLSTQFSVLVSSQDGEGASNGDNGIEFLGIPTVDVKYYVTYNESHWDPYVLIGVGLYAVSEGTIANGTPAIGMGGNAGVGVDYYFNQKISAGFSGIFRSVGLIGGTSGANSGSGIFPFQMSGYLGWHF